MNINQDKIIESVFLEEEEKKLSIFEHVFFKFTQHFSVRLFEKLCQGEIEGSENIANLNSGFIIACNHTSYLDWLVLFSLFKLRYNKEITFLAKEKLFKHVLFRKLIKAAKCIKVTDSGINISSMRKILRTTRNNGIIGIFPEGTRTNNGELLKAKEGIIKIALAAKVPIVPVGLQGFYEIWPRNKLFPTRLRKCKIKIGNPLYFDNLSDSLSDKDIAQHTSGIMKNIGDLINKSYNYA
ncbi:hypothetical protein A2291_06075 [candidate division WOR-1 bacterium RIFOXYB2_FULL_42_35]|uniref:Phospholipid/glycerol acyltransferase domain-containing protein n=1 Tax=candidate division WOR-1 bacterium RIFOXYC2_FULL_41_25 TaxID=1802586 RepID=A0A1F4TK69_UNCSA|nr:MAG: hypothetical protein A2247_01735 [candidate division WOR-1 bacterium RIFOXYA2_FULL_41_14]OGC22291.1 MAG: hypothetical protein A2291_06075 [candidate division WOR-1 bacterium RIFOXYB2_FULL_42_35]OGC32910.1 MAG: hypothetical protein A2462_00750 [candidate division WOR-1 bacterium RIFOXYC2_FULL_41_25]OGC41718.1 MAG: hypothetical protein A2548_04990 [candidate division WOR-1 bacterium RIFOXYD2_FULL_41_8]